MHTPKTKNQKKKKKKKGERGVKGGIELSVSSAYKGKSVVLPKTFPKFDFFFKKIISKMNFLINYEH
jgi:hypothetical protein